ncbi:helix-turn-helix transcriptional regulator [Aquidulcibacter sp.]|uniref:helix-turn-helix transcriptional regulator n=1 Tax=Aquidulcibacter sp. TaxID=2052990 RepID=UPI00345B72E2
MLQIGGAAMLQLTDIAQHVRESRKAQKLTQAALAARAGISRAQIERLENDKLGDMGIVLILRVLRVLDLELTLQAFNHGRPTLDDLVKDNEG